MSVGSVRSSIALLGGNVGVNILTVLGSVLVMRWSEPGDIGLWNAAMLVVTYASVLQLGVFNGLNRQYAFLVAKNESRLAIGVRDIGYGWAVTLSILTLGASLFLCLFLGALGKSFDDRYYLLVIGTGCFLAASWMTQYFTAIFSASAAFTVLAKYMLVASLIGVFLTVLVFVFGYEGLITRAALIGLVTASLLYAGCPSVPRIKWDVMELLQLVRIGFPIWVLGQSATVLQTLDRLVLADSPEALGLYTVAIQVGVFTALIPTTLSAIAYQQMAVHYGKNCDSRALWMIAFRFSLASLALSSVGGLLGWFMVPFLTKTFLPAYLEGVPAAQWAALVGIPLSLAIVNSVYNVIGKQFLYFWSAAASLTGFFLAWNFFNEVGINEPTSSAIKSSLFSMLVGGLCSTAFSYSICFRRKHI